MREGTKEGTKQKTAAPPCDAAAILLYTVSPSPSTPSASGKHRALQGSLHRHPLRHHQRSPCPAPRPRYRH